MFFSCAILLLTEKGPDMATNNTKVDEKVITKFQVLTLQKLIAEREVPQIVRDLLNDKWARKDFSTADAFAFIGELGKLPFKPGVVDRNRGLVGIHVLNGKTFKVMISKNGNLYAREIVTVNGVATEVYAPEAVMFLSAKTKVRI